MAGTRNRFVFTATLDYSLITDEAKLIAILNESNFERILKARDHEGYSYLHLAAKANAHNAVHLLLDKGADPNAKSSTQAKGQTPLHVAGEEGNEAVLQLMLNDHRADVRVLDTTGKSPLDYALKIKSKTMLDKLECYWSEDTLRHCQIFEVLNDALRTNQSVAILKLINKDERKDLITFQSYSGESIALRSDTVLNSLELIQRVDYPQCEIPAVLTGCSVIHWACQHGQKDLILYFIKLIPDIMSHTSNEGYTPLHMLAIYNQVDILKELIRILRTQHLQSLSLSESTTAVPKSAGSDVMVMVAKEIITLGDINFDVITKTKHTPLHLAAAMGNVEFVDALVSHASFLDLNLDVSDILGLTPLHLTLRVLPKDDNEKWLNVIHMLLKSRVSVNTDALNPDSVGVYATPLTQVCGMQQFDLVELLGRHGAKDSKRSAINLCIRRGYPYKVMTSILSHVIAMREDKYSVMWQNVQFPGDMNPDWVADALVSAHMTHHQLRSIKRNVLPLIEAAVTVVDLSSCGLHRLPIEVFYFPNLEVLSANKNKLEGLPLGDSTERGLPEIPWKYSLLHSGWLCLKLRSLLLKENQLKSIPECVFQLPCLKTLDVSHNKLTELPSNMWIAPQLEELYCLDNNLVSLPSNDKLILSRSLVAAQSSEVEVIKSNRHASFIAERTTLIERKVVQLLAISESQRYLDVNLAGDKQQRVFKSQVSVVRTSLSDKLEERLMVHHPDLLYLNDPSDSASTTSIGLRVLSLGKNDISALPVDFPCLCPNLHELDLSKNMLTQVQFPYIFPDALVHLNLAGNPLQQIDCTVEPPRVTFCTIPRASSDSRTITSLPNEPFHCDVHGSSRLSNLLRLRLVHCQLRTLNLYSHTNIVLANEDLVDHKFDPEARVDIVGGKIEQLNISSNLLKEVHSSIVHLTHLVTFNISHNPDIIQVPKELGRLRKLKEIHFDGLNLINPPMELLGKGTKSHDIIGYLSSLYLKAQPYHRLKLMLVGWENMGKTTLLRKLMEKGQRSEERNIFIKRLRPNNQGGSLSTVGISLRDWIYRRTAGVYNDIRQITFRTWDFGGQDEFYATHQIFLTPKAVYLAVWNVLHGRGGVERLKLWLLNINARVHRAAVIIVGTHVDMLSRDDQAKLHSEILKDINTFYKIPPYTPGAMHKARWNPPLGFPQVMASVVVSSKSGYGISQLRDIIYEVSTSLKEGGIEDSGPIANRARYVLTQLYPASYLWLEDKVRKMVIRYHSKKLPPVLTTQQFMDEIFTDIDNMFNGDSAVEDLDKAVRFLCASGTIVHQEDPVLADLYFIDPQWLCDMFAHVITIRSINGWIARESGIMMKDDLERVFIDQEFPIKWKEEYIRLMTIFEVVVEIDHTQLLIPSHVKDESLEDPFLSLTKGLNCLPPLHHFLFLPHIPSGFWVRLISRILGDSSIVSMVTTGFGAKNVKNFFGRNLPFSWCLVKRGIMLKYEDFPVITVRELPGRQIFQLRNCQHVHYLDSESGQTWKKIENRNQTAIEVIVNDLYPLLVLEEVQYAYQKNDVEGLRQFPFVEFDTSIPSEEYRVSSPPHASVGPVQPTLPLPPVYIVDGFDLETEIRITRNPRIRMHTRRKEVGRLGPVRLREIGPDDGIKDTEHEEDITPRSRTHNLLSILKPKARNLEPVVQPAKRALSKRQMKTTVYKTAPELDKPDAPPTLKEDVYDIKRAAVFAQILDHIRSIWEDWYPKLKSSFVRTDEEKVPCPFCWENRPSGRPRLARSFSSRSEISDGVKLLVKPDFECEFVVPPPPPASGPPNPKEVQGDIVGVDPPSWEEPNHYMFNFFHYLDVCPHLSVCFCPRHHTIPSQYVIPNMTFQSVRCDIIADIKDLHFMEYIDTGNFAEVEKRKWVRKRGEQTVTSEVAMKVMKTSSERVKYHITLEKEMTVINDLDHPNIIKCLGIVLHPLAAILELAPMGNLRSIYLEYLNEDLLIPLRVVHKTLIDVTSAVQYLHSKNIIYHDLKASNVLVWRYMSPGQQLTQDDNSILGDEVVHVKLADFNISVVVPLVEKIHHLRGTPGFIAPELANYKHGLYTNKVDMFSLGSFIYELITCQRPYEKEDPSVMYKGYRPHLYKKHRVFPVLLLELMYWCWEMRVDVRPSASDVLRALLSDQCLRLLMGINIHNNMYPKSVALWWGKPCNQGDSSESLPQQPPSSYTAQTPIHRLWVACSDFYSSCLTILDWEEGHFTAVQDISSGASSVLCMKTVGDSVWVGFEHGYLMVYDAATKCPKAQLWPKGRAMVVQTIAHIPSLQMVYLGFGNGFVWAVSDNLVSKDTNVMVTGPLTPLAEFDDLTKTISAILPVPVGGANQYELWVGQNDQTIVILDPKRSGNAEDSSHTLEVKEYITITHDMSTLPQYLSDSFVSHLVLEELSLGDKPSPSDGQTSFLYSALFSGQVVSRWAVNSRKCVSSYDIVTCDSIKCTKESGPWITSLHSNSQHIYIGLTSGDIIILRAGTLMELTTLSCHHQQVKCLITMPTPVGKKEHSSTTKLVSCGLGFKSYYDPKPVDPAFKTLPEALEPAKLLLWNVANI